ncbi:TetR/AcrR family transcriptional regulator [Erythrobacter sp. YT30]|uniref:TetR/AcrR family transcriptional regulator n=1 Tax=Erythrobacter sp. YT30 TaxID=1735012 RepID=UPI00076D3973|nr:TetR/AcrR family transcriptional regulator [Erythrobacter sp. YT30]KWV92249.1 transcriptional regulator [Erythrobacter sp. YT30]
MSSETQTKEPEKKLGRPTDDAKRKAIIDAAAHHFFEHGFASTAIEHVAADAGVSKVTVYNHFGNKRALFDEAVEVECEKMRGYFSLEAMPNGTISERLNTIGEAMFDFLMRPEMMRFEHRIAAETQDDPEIGLAFLKAGPWRMKAAFADFLAHADETGELKIADPALAAEQFVSMCKGMGDLERRFGSPVSAEMRKRRISGAVEVFVAAYGVR